MRKMNEEAKELRRYKVLAIVKTFVRGNVTESWEEVLVCKCVFLQ